MTIEHFMYEAGSDVARSMASPGLLLIGMQGGPPPQVVRLPPELGGTVHPVTRSWRGPCPKCGHAQARHLRLRHSRKVRAVAECPGCKCFWWYNPPTIAVVKVDDGAHYFGTEADGYYYQAAEGPDGRWYVSAIADLDTAAFCGDCGYDDEGPFDSQQEAERETAAWAYDTLAAAGCLDDMSEEEHQALRAGVLGLSGEKTT